MQKAISSKQQDGTLHVKLIIYWQQAAKPCFIMLWTHLKEWVCYPTHTLLWPCSSMLAFSSSDSSVMLSGATCCRFRCRFFMSLSLILVFWCSKSETESWSCESYKPLMRVQNGSEGNATQNKQTNNNKIPETTVQKESENLNLNLKTLFYKDCSLGSVKTCLTTSPC